MWQLSRNPETSSPQKGIACISDANKVVATLVAERASPKAIGHAVAAAVRAVRMPLQDCDYNEEIASRWPLLRASLQ